MTERPGYEARSDRQGGDESVISLAEMANVVPEDRGLVGSLIPTKSGVTGGVLAYPEYPKLAVTLSRHGANIDFH